MSRLITLIDVLYLKWALHSIHPLHREVPYIVATLNARRPL